MQKLPRAWIVRFGLLLAILVTLSVPTQAKADSEARSGADWIRITANACTDAKVLANIAGRGENALDFRAARAEFQGTPFAACWKPNYQAGDVELRYDDGDRGEVSIKLFRPVTTI